MLPAKTSFQLTSSRTNPTKILALRIPEDLASKLVALASTAESARIVLDPSNPSGNRLLLGSDESFTITVAPETQTVDVARSNVKRRSVQVVGRVKEKLSVKQELASEKASAIRAQSELAEKERLARKTMTIEEPLKSSAAVSSSRSRSAVGARSRLLQRVVGGKKPPSGPSASPRPARPTSTTTQTSCERVDKSSTHTWSPPIDVFSKPPEPSLEVVPRSAPKPKKQRLSVDKTAEKPTTAAVPMDPVYQQLYNRYQSKVSEYKMAEQWVNRRLSIFEQLQKDLNTASGNQSATERIANRVAIENEKLRADKEYKWKMAELDQLRSDLETLKSRLESHA